MEYTHGKRPAGPATFFAERISDRLCKGASPMQVCPYDACGRTPHLNSLWALGPATFLKMAILPARFLASCILLSIVLAVRAPCRTPTPRSSVATAALTA